MAALLSPQVVFASNVAPTYPGGLAAYQEYLAAALAGSGVSGAFLCLSDRHSQLPVTARDLPWPVTVLRPAASFAATQRRWPMLAGRPFLWPVLEMLAGRAWQPPSCRPEVVHFIGTGWDFFGFWLRRWARRIGARFTIWPAVHPRQWGDDRIDLRLYSEADAIFCQTEFERGYLRSLGVPGPKLELCGLFPMGGRGGDAARFRAAHGLDDRPLAFFLGRRDEGKGYPAVLAAWERVRERLPEARLVLGGPPDPKSLPLPSGVIDLGVVTGAEKDDAMAACTVFCLPSAHESFGIVITEAWACGRPAICGTAEASRELVEDGVTGLWSDQHPATLAEALVRLLGHPGEADRLGAAGRAVQQARFTEEICLRKHLEVFRLERPGRPADNRPRS